MYSAKVGTRFFWLVGVFLLTACTLHQPLSATSSRTIGPFFQPHGRILLLGNHRAQLLFRCRQQEVPNSNGLKKGSCRFTHGASGRIIDIRWQGATIEMRENTHPSWQKIDQPQLRHLGITIAPSDLMAILHGTIPDWLHPLRNGVWQGRHHGQHIQLEWRPETRQIDAIDLSRGNRIRLFLDTTP
ncbi:MAG: hypothetical protein Q9M26_00825 [Mariprofundales bacterium]|nr:hypothetical protein [Mariprofundales bacterium]